MAFPPAPERAGAAASPAPEVTCIDGRTVRNAAWLGVAQVLRQAVAVGAAIMLARYLGPTDYGLFAIVFFINELAQSLVDFGIGTAIVQRKAVDQRLLSTCFWVNLGLSLGGALVLVALAGLGWTQHHARWWPSLVFDQAEARRVARFSALVSPLSEAVARASFPVLAQAQDAAAQMRARLLGSIELLALTVAGAGGPGRAGGQPGAGGAGPAVAGHPGLGAGHHRLEPAHAAGRRPRPDAAAPGPAGPGRHGGLPGALRGHGRAVAAMGLGPAARSQ